MQRFPGNNFGRSEARFLAGAPFLNLDRARHYESEFIRRAPCYYMGSGENVWSTGNLDQVARANSLTEFAVLFADDPDYAPRNRAEEHLKLLRLEFGCGWGLRLAHALIIRYVVQNPTPPLPLTSMCGVKRRVITMPARRARCAPAHLLEPRRARGQSRRAARQPREAAKRTTCAPNRQPRAANRRASARWHRAPNRGDGVRSNSGARDAQNTLVHRAGRCWSRSGPTTASTA
jgi:hypothetical protein